MSSGTRFNCKSCMPQDLSSSIFPSVPKTSGRQLAGNMFMFHFTATPRFDPTGTTGPSSLISIGDGWQEPEPEAAGHVNVEIEKDGNSMK